jgi:hypothetical protein
MSRTTAGGTSIRQVAAQRGRNLIQQERQRKREFKSLQEGGNKPKIKKPKLGPLLRS